MALSNIKTGAYWSTYGTNTVTGTTTLIDPTASDSAYLCYGYIELTAATGTKRADVVIASTTTHMIWGVDGTAGNIGTKQIVNFGETGLRFTIGATLYLETSASMCFNWGFAGYTA